MQSNFEAEKNQKALTYTVVICGVLLLLFFIITWPIHKIADPPLIQDLIEVNLGNDFEGFGEEQPLIKGEKAPSQDPSPQNNQATAASEEPAKDVETDDNANEEAAPVTKVEKNNSKKLDAPKENVTKPVKTNNPSPVPTPAPPKPQKPKATYGGVKGEGNGATESNDKFGQGNDKNGKGDAGTVTGKPDSYGNNPGGKSGVSVVKGAKPLNFGSLKLEDDFNENAKVYLDVRYNISGGFVSSAVSKGTTTTKSAILSIAKREAAKLKFPPSSDGGVTTILFNFKVQN